MLRKAAIVLSITALLGVIVAFGQAQDPTPTPARRPTPAQRPTIAPIRTANSLSDRFRAQQSESAKSIAVTASDSEPTAADGSSRRKRGVPSQTQPSVEPTVKPNTNTATRLRAPSQVAPIEPAPIVNNSPATAPRTTKAPIVNGSKTSRAPISSSSDRTGYRAAIVSGSQVKGISLTSQGPNIRVAATGDGSIVIGKEGAYQVEAINDGSVAASEVYIRVNVPSWIELERHQPSKGTIRMLDDSTGGTQIVWAIPQLAGRSSEKLQLVLRPTASRSFEFAVDWTFTPVTQQASIEVQEPKLEAQISGASEMRFGDETTMLVTVSNPGTGPAENVEIQFGLGDSIETMRIDQLAAGQTKEIEIPITADQAGELNVNVTVSADGGLNVQRVSRLTVRSPKLSVAAAGPGLKYSGSKAAYRITVSNAGDAAAKNVMAAARLPSGAKYLSGLANSVAADGGLVWTVGDLSPGAERVFNIICELHTAGANQLAVVIRDDDDLQATGEVITKVQSIADLKLIVNDPKGPLPVGEAVVYEIQIENRGTKEAVDVNILALFSAGIDPIEVAGGRAELSGDGQVRFSPVSRIAPGQKVEMRITAKASQAGNHVFRIKVACDNPETALAAEDTTRFFGDLSQDSSNFQTTGTGGDQQPTAATRPRTFQR